MKKQEIPFDQLTIQQQRVVILKDALKHLNEKRIQAATGHMVGLVGAELLVESNYGKELQSIIKQPEAKCTVCARGAVLYSMVWRNDNFILDNTCLGRGEMGGAHGDNKKEDEFIEKLFPAETLMLMEAAFEYNMGPHSYLEGVDDAYAFGENYEDDDLRLEAILKNAIKNKGIFKP